MTSSFDRLRFQLGTIRAKLLRRLVVPRDVPSAALEENTKGRVNYVVCGDIISCTGYARSARALAEMLSSFGDVMGVPLQVDLSDRDQKFPGKIIGLADLFQIATNEPTVVIHHSTPENFFIVPDAINIGFFYWETRTIPHQLHWVERLSMMDAIWAPTRFVADLAAECKFGGPIYLVPWMQEFDLKSKDIDLQTNVKFIDALPASGSSLWTEVLSVDRLRARFDFICLAVQSLAPRKGLQLLLDEWRRFLAENPKANAVLLLKLSFVHALGIDGGSEVHLRRLLLRYGFRERDLLSIAVVDERVLDDGLRGLYNICDVYLTASLGEGFGGPVVEAIQAKKPVICSRHTGVADLLPTDFPLIVKHKELLVGLQDNLPVYPHSCLWNVVQQGAMADRLSHFLKTESNERLELAEKLWAHAEAFCGRSAVKRALAEAVKGACK